MCGIVGIVNNGDRKASREVLERMNRAILHRGPDDDGFYVNKNVGLAMRRLSIIDLASGKQPIRNADNTKWIVFNGEIYNYQELRKDLEKRGHRFYTNSDTEAIVHLYDEYGVDCLQHLRGMFAMAIWDETEQDLFLARDRVGKKPLLYSLQQNGDLIFGSEFNAVLQHPDISREVDNEAIDSYLSYLCVPAPMTAFKAIRKLEPGHWMKWKSGQIAMERYWLPDFSKKIKITEEEAIDETTRILRESTKLRMISEVPLGAFLSGGVDSSTVVALMAQESSGPVKTFSIGFEEQDFSELKYAKRVAEHVGAEYNEFIVRPNALEILPTLVEHYGEPYADSSAIPTYYVAKETRKHVTVALNGDGGDESFAGYERYAAMKAASTFQKIPAVVRMMFVENPLRIMPALGPGNRPIERWINFLRASALSKEERYFKWVSTFDHNAKATMYTDEFRASLLGKQAFSTIGKWFSSENGIGSLDSLLRIDQLTYLPNDLLTKVDIASMANSLEARSPFLDHKLIEFAASIPESIKMNRFETKSLLKKVAVRLVPKDVVYRKKMGFGVPIGKWFRSEMKNLVCDALLSSRSMRRGLVRPDVVTQYVKEHIDGKADHSFRIWTLLMLELWFQRFID
ncbi:MAG TPA: asparagine synthase (glutamine-hydrolyzing) [Pyrinomonadaceae bacterium]|nr:asparagine synthase (glutamine-hydrolyzing) [Chloracidobacterium sp.]HBE81581.1 asparagine synthase (glutamine-hydrolyzing) [Blastocatellia bacterium]HRJ88825.1 asparagine synthase (glutamine-hydrolyzing) [Pyrinomonadaceae bacterium]HRK48902.1 asparagine synthase (glutamine-hydrolyzing) [Pyrinomonadaceae bacterium]